ncbi:MAG TPA: hypothetical protein ENH29_04865 [Bacteroidetes bacterium]|nr:hypothetical protein [Bacteroidota bacterium]
MRYFHNSLSLFILSLAILAAKLPAQEAAYNHPELKWFTIETEHFQVHFHEGAGRTAKAVAQIAESIYSPITKLYDYHKKTIFHFIIRDHDDYSNGAAYYYDNKVEVWATPMDFDFRGTHPWLLNVISHEFTHMISLDKAKKFGDRIPALYFQYWGYEKETRPDVLRGFPNRIVSFPIAGSAIPPWFAEGIAQFQAPDNAFDFWDTHRDMILRVAALDNKMLTYDQMSSFGHNSLGNEMVYNSGYDLVIYIAKFYGNDALRRIVSSMKAPLRYSIGGAIKKVLGKSETELYNEWKSYLRKIYAAGVKDIRNNLVQGKIIESDGFGNLYPIWSPVKNQIAYISNKGQDFLGLTSLVLYNLDANKKKAIKGGVRSSVSFSHDGTKIVYAKRRKANFYGSKYFDLFLYNLNSKKEKQLTRGARARNPMFSHDSNSIVCVSGRDGTDNLSVYDVTSGTLQKITSFKNGEQIFHPAFSPDDQQIVFDLSTGHGRNIALIDKDGGQFRYLIRDKHDARSPVFHPTKNIIYFSWDKTGIFNIYQYNLQTKKSVQMTNVLGGAFTPSFNPKRGLIYSLFTADGYKIAQIEKPQTISKTDYPAENRLIRNGPVTPLSQFKGKSKNGSNGSSSEAPNPAHPYRSVYGSVNFLPRVIVDYGTLKLGTYLYSSEVLNKYNVFGGFAMNREKDMDTFGIFEYNQFYPTIFLEIYNQIQHSSAGIDKYRYNLLETDFGVQSPVLSENNIARAMVVYSRYNGHIETTISGQQIKFGYTYMIGRSLSFLLRHNSTRLASDMNINPSGGRKFSLRYDWQNNKFINGFKINSTYGTLVEKYLLYRYNQLELHWEEYFKLPWQHTVTLKLNSGYIDRKIDSFFNFFAGGILGMKGYPYYSIEGRKLLSSSLIYRFKLLDNLNFKLTPVKFDKLYGALFFEYGNAWDAGKPEWDRFIKDAGVQLRLETYSFYNFPTRFFFDAAYGFDKVVNRKQHYGREWRFYFGVAFDYID